MALESDCDCKVHGRLEKVVPGERVLVTTGAGETLTLRDPDGIVSTEVEGQSRTLEVRLMAYEVIEPTDREPGLYAAGTRVDAVSEYSGEPRPRGGAEKIYFSLPGHFYGLGVDPPTGDTFGELPWSPGETIAARGLRLRVTDCSYLPNFDPFFPPIVDDVQVTIASDVAENDPDASASGGNARPTEPRLSVSVEREGGGSSDGEGTEHDGQDDGATENDETDEQTRRLDVGLPDETALDALGEACQRLFDQERATVPTAEGDLKLAVVRDGVRYLNYDVVRLGTGDEIREDAPVYLVDFQRAVGNALLECRADWPDGGLVVDVLRRGLAELRDGRLGRLHDPIENYFGLCQGYALAQGDPPTKEAPEISAEALDSWACYDRTFDTDLAEAYHHYNLQ